MYNRQRFAIGTTCSHKCSAIYRNQKNKGNLDGKIL